jgi:hypothetical protein
VDYAGKNCLYGWRLYSLVFPCPQKVNPLILRARLLDSGATSKDQLTVEELEGLTLLCSNCEGFM